MVMRNDVRRRRRDRGLTQAELATLVGVSRQTLIAIELGGSPSLPTAMRLARALDTRLDDLFPDHAAAADRNGDEEHGQEQQR